MSRELLVCQTANNVLLWQPYFVIYIYMCFSILKYSFFFSLNHSTFICCSLLLSVIVFTEVKLTQNRNYEKIGFCWRNMYILAISYSTHFSKLKNSRHIFSMGGILDFTQFEK